MYSRSVLLLNATYQPIRVISHKRAITLVIQEKAEVIENSDDFINTSTTQYPIPSIIRLTYFVKIPRRARIPLNRRTVLIRDDKKCQFTHCSRIASTIDHIIPTSKGGKNVWENVAAACQKCNAKKADKMLDEIGWHLRNVPRQPSWDLWLVAGIRDRPEWAEYLAYSE